MKARHACAWLAVMRWTVFTRYPLKLISVKGCLASAHWIASPASFRIYRNRFGMYVRHWAQPRPASCWFSP
ncbi:hypothetical protein D3C77_606230 [compost metagenome]